MLALYLKDSTGPLPTQTVRQRRCQDSCSAIVFTKEAAPTALHSSAPTAALAASAVSALLKGHTHQDEPIFSTDSPKKLHVERSESLPATTSPRNRNRAPDRLPPLIEKLVGSTEPNLPVNKDDASTSDKHSDFLDFKTNKKAANSFNHGDNNRLGLQQQLASPEDSVAAIAAAAAAATIFSHQDLFRRGTHGRLRMKTYNDQWEAALRWVASWDDATLQTFTRVSPHPLSTDTQAQAASNKPSSSSPRRKKKIKPSQQVVSSDAYRAGPSGNQNHSNLDLLFEACVRKCMRNGIGSSLPIQASSNKMKRAQSQFQGVKLLNRTYHLVLGHLQWDVHVLSPFGVDGRITVFGGVLGIIFSSMALWSILNAVSWRKVHKTTSTVLLQVLEDESIKFRGQEDLGSIRPNKKHPSKKSKRKKVNLKDARNKSHIPVGSLDHRHSLFVPPKAVDEEESLESDDSYDLSHLRESRSPVKLVSRASVDVVSFGRMRTSSYGHTGSITSNSTEDADSQIMALPASDPFKECHDDKCKVVPPTAPLLSAPKIQSNDRGSISNESSSSSSHHNSVKILTKPAVPLGNTVLKIQNVEPNMPSLMLPTDEQREEAARKLREFQLAQVTKIMHQREEKRIQEQLKKQSSPSACMNEVHRSRPQDMRIAELSSPKLNGAIASSGNVCRYPQGVYTFQSSQSESVSEDGDRDILFDELSRETFLLSSILDEEEEVSKIHDEALISCNSINSPPSMKFSNIQQLNVSYSNESQDSFPLNIAAASFSPSWGRGENKEQGIW